MTPIEPCASDRPASRWIPCSERLPAVEPGKLCSPWVLIYIPAWSEIEKAVYVERGAVWNIGGGAVKGRDVSHWMPLPPVPKGDGE